jgi:uncharacterized lipoprotein YmbA
MKSLIAALAALAIGGCASAPVSLVALPAAPAADSHPGGAGPTVLVREVTVPGYLEGFPVVVARTGSAVVVSKDTEWAERPSDGVARVLRDALSQRLEPSRVLIEGDGRVPDVDLTIEFLALDPREGALHLDARWLFACSAGRASHGGRTESDVPLASATPAAVATSTSEALARFGDVLAHEIPTECRPFGDDVVRARR